MLFQIDLDVWAKNRRLEEIIVRAIGRLGPAVAIARPNVALELGAARTYMSDQEWQPEVDKWIDRAILIVVVVGATNGLESELKRIFEKGLAQKLLCIFPREGFEARVAELQSLTSNTPWALDPCLKILTSTHVLRFLRGTHLE
jgi:uncharacterized protein YciU (UPF0263 family)